MTENFWCVERDVDADPRWPYCPTLQIPGSCFSLPIWFPTAEECANFIRREVLGAELETDDTRR